MTKNNDTLVVVGQPVWLYPANGKWGGSIEEKAVANITPHQRWGDWWELFFTDGKKFRTRFGRSTTNTNLYSTKESAEAQQTADRAEPMWMRRGKLHILCGATLVQYLSVKTGIKPENIQLSKTESGNLHLAWADKAGFHKEKVRIGKFYSLTEAKLAPVVEMMMPKPKKRTKKVLNEQLQM